MKIADFTLPICLVAAAAIVSGCTIEIKPIAPKKPKRHHATAIHKKKSKATPTPTAQPATTPNWSDRYWPHDD